MTDAIHESPTNRGTPAQENRDARSLLREAVGNTFRAWAGWVFYGFGALLVVIGYIGISGEAVVAKQLPYLISGGIGGILLAVLGAYLLGIEELRKDSGRLDRIENQIRELHLALLSHPDLPGPAPGSVGPTRYVAVDAGRSFHLETCALVAGKTAVTVAFEDVSARGLHPCKVCEPTISAE